MASHQHIKVILVYFLLLIGTTFCSSAEERLLQDAKNEAGNGHFKIAVAYFEKFLARSPESKQAVYAAREVARISFYELQDFNKAAKYYQLLVLSSPDAEERLTGQKQIVSVFFDHLSDYGRAIVEINKVVVMLVNKSDQVGYKMKLARAYYYQNNFIQAENEVEELLLTNPPQDLKFDIFILKGNINLAKKDLLKASEIFKKILIDFPERAIKENVGLTLSVCLEEQKDYKGAVEVLEKMRSQYSTPEYIDIRIHRLQGRFKNLPGAHGKNRK